MDSFRKQKYEIFRKKLWSLEIFVGIRGKIVWRFSEIFVERSFELCKTKLNLYFAKRKSVLCGMKICTFTKWNLYFTKWLPNRHATHRNLVKQFAANTLKKLFSISRPSFRNTWRVLEDLSFSGLRSKCSRSAFSWHDVRKTRNTFGRGRKRELVLLGHEKKTWLRSWL